MSEQPQTAPVTPADLPPETLIPYDSFAHLMPGTHRTLVERKSRRGTFIPGVRMTDRSPLLFEAGAVAAWLEKRMASLKVAAYVTDEDVQAMSRDIQSDRSSAVGAGYSDGTVIL